VTGEPGLVPDGRRLLRTFEVAEAFRVNPRTVYRWAREGKLTPIKTLGGHRRYPAAQVRALLALPADPQNP
jgi:excisionase family DNA binding protein